MRGRNWKKKCTIYFSFTYFYFVDQNEKLDQMQYENKHTNTCTQNREWNGMNRMYNLPVGRDAHQCPVVEGFHSQWHTNTYAGQKLKKKMHNIFFIYIFLFRGFVVYCTCAKHRVVEYYRVCRFRDVILKSSISYIFMMRTSLQPYD
jgi:hypothetical protein